MYSPETKLSNKTNASSLNQYSRKTLILKVRVKVSYFSRNFENLQRFFTGEPWPWRPWTWCPHGVFGGKLSFKKMSAGGRLCTLQENPHFWIPRIKVRPPDGTSITLTEIRLASMVSSIFCFAELTFLSRRRQQRALRSAALIRENVHRAIYQSFTCSYVVLLASTDVTWQTIRHEGS